MDLMGGLSTKMLEVRYYKSQMISEKITKKKHFFIELTRRLFFNIEDYVRYVHLYFANNTKIDVFKNFLQFELNYPNNCARLDIKNVLSLRGLRRLKVKFEEVPNSDFKAEIRLEDVAKTTYRSNFFNRFSNSGPRITTSLSQTNMRSPAKS